ncbi:peptide-methionine (S)-S-oxide reductase [Nostoc sp. CCY0012]|uniref:peptide-methionine (S)-S-oxide reductase n=1 Tax=Nostoc sp. CCY0012 TaxID=1056123 RepID=UPI0039C61441
MADLLTLLILQSQLSHSILTFKITNSQRKSTYTGIHHGVIAKLFGLLKESKAKIQVSGRFERDIVTEIKEASEYYLASEEHQQYFEKKGIG